MVVFLEEDHYVVPDVLHMLNLLEETRRQYCSHCNVLSLGTYLKTVNFGADSGRVSLQALNSMMALRFKRPPHSCCEPLGHIYYLIRLLIW